MKSDKETKVCFVCGKEFVGASNRKFCGNDCNMYYRKTNEWKIELAKAKVKRKDIVQEALKAILTFEYILHEELHNRLNLYVRENSNKKDFDIEFIDLSEKLEKFDKNEHRIEWKIENIAGLYTRRNVYLRLGDKEYCERIDKEEKERLEKKKSKKRRIKNGK